MRDPLESVLGDWSRLGVLYGVTRSRNTPDIETLLIRTALQMPSFARLLPTTVTWLCEYERLICRHRLAHLAGQIEEADTSAAMGLSLEFAQQQTGSDHLNIAIEACRPAAIPKPMFTVDRRPAALSRLAEREASDVSRRWCLWSPEPTLKFDALRPAKWLMKTNPVLRPRAVFGGNLRASILATLRAEPDAGGSESALARACGVTRKATREALDHLEFCGFISREPSGRRKRIVLGSALVTF